MMYGNLTLLVFISLLVLINGQYDDEKDLPQDLNLDMFELIRSSKSSFDAQFQRGRCPDRFYQLGDECLYFATDGKRYSWHQAQRVCAQRIADSLERQTTSFVIGQPSVKPTKGGVRQIILNTPEKTKILEALFREYDELNFLVRLPSDYNTLHRCRDGKQDYWPKYCGNLDASNATCFETSELGANNICLRQIDCNKYYSRLACEFTLSGSSELTASKFRHCSKSRGLGLRLSIWAWLLVAVGGMLLLLLVLGGVLAFLNSKKELSQIKQSVPERRHTEQQALDITSTGENPPSDPMLLRATSSSVSEIDYLQPQSLKRVVPPTVPTTNTVRQNDNTPNV